MNLQSKRASVGGSNTLADETEMTSFAKHRYQRGPEGQVVASDRQVLWLVHPESAEVAREDLDAARTKAFGKTAPGLAISYCGDVLRNAGHLLDTGRSESEAHRLLGRAVDLLDELDETLIALDPVRDTGTFALAATLHRDLEYLQAALATRRRARKEDVPQ